MKVKSLSRFRLLVTPWTATYQAPPSMGFSRQEYWSGVPLPSPTLMIIFYKHRNRTVLFKAMLENTERVIKTLLNLPGCLALDEKMATHSSVLAWRIPGMGKPGGLPSMGSHSVGHD